MRRRGYLLIAFAGLAGIAGAFALTRRAGARPTARTIVLVTFDTLRRDYVGAYGLPAGTGLTPRLDAFASTAVRFDDARTPVPLTLPAHATMFSGLPPALHGARTNTASRIPGPANRSFRLLAERFTEVGRCCGAFVSAEPLSPRYGLTQGFSVYDAEGVAGGAGGTTYLRRAGTETVTRALAWLRARPADESVFLWVHLFDAHEPHAIDYRTDVSAADRAFGVLLDNLPPGRSDATVLATADHGEALGDLLEPSHGFLLGESVLRIPMFLRSAGLEAGVRTDPVDLADVAPTLLSLGGVTPPPPSDVPGTGRDLGSGPTPTDRARVAESLHGYHQHRWAQLSAAIVGPWKFEDRGTGRTRIQRLDAPDAASSDGGPADGAPVLVSLADALRSYRRLEDRRPTAPGDAPGGYGSGGVVGFFLEPDANGRLPDPYSVITDDGRLQATVRLLALTVDPPRARLEAALRDLDRSLGTRDAGDPALAFWRARLLRGLGQHEDAVTAFDRAISLGGPNAEADLMAARSERALGRNEAALLRVERGRQAHRADDRHEREAAEALRALHRDAEADAAALEAKRIEAAKREPIPLAPCR